MVILFFINSFYRNSNSQALEEARSGANARLNNYNYVDGNIRIPHIPTK